MESEAMADNKRVSGSGLQPSPKSPSATSDARNTIYEIPNPAFENKKYLYSFKFNLKYGDNENENHGK